MTRRVMQALRDAGAVLKRQKKHHVYELPNGKNVVVASTPSDFRAENNTLRDIKKVAGVEKPVKPASKGAGRTLKPGRREADWSRPVLAEALTKAGVADAYLHDRITALELDNVALTARGDRWRALAGETDAKLADLQRTRWVRLGMWLQVIG